MGASWEPPGNLLEASWGLLGSLGRLLGASCHKLAFECEVTASWRRLGTVLGPSWVRPGPLLGSPGRPLVTSWSLLGLSRELLRPSRKLLEPSWDHLVALFGVLRRKSMICQKPTNTYRNSTLLGGRRVQDAAKLGQVRRKKGPRWHLEAILEPRRPKMAGDGEDGIEDAA